MIYSKPISLLTIWFLTLGTLAACSLFQKPDIDHSVPEAIYFSTETDSLLSREEIEEEELYVVTSMEQLAAVVETSETVKIIYFHPDVIASVDSQWLRKTYDAGIVIVALNTPIKLLTEKLGTRSTVFNLNMENAFGRIGVTIVHSRENAEDVSGHSYFSEFLPNFHAATNVVKQHFLEKQSK